MAEKVIRNDTVEKIYKRHVSAKAGADKNSGSLWRNDATTTFHKYIPNKKKKKLLHSDMGIAVLAFPLVDVVKITQRCPTLDSKVI